MTTSYTVTRCNDCDQDISKTAQYYDYANKKVTVRCCNCNFRKGGEEYPRHTHRKKVE